jgi:hypothetical protein
LFVASQTHPIRLVYVDNEVRFHKHLI